MTIAQGVFKRVAYKRQTVFGTIATNGAGQGQLLRRVTSSLDLEKETYRSNEIRPDLQRADFRHGIRAVRGSINGELSVGTYKDFYESFCRQLYQVGATTGSQSIGFAASGMTRAAGSFITDGFKQYDIVRAAGFSNNTLNARNFLVTNVTATNLDGFFLDGQANLVLAAAVGVTVTLQGKKTWLPLTGHVNHAYTIEHFFSDINESEAYDSCRLGTMNVSLPATGFATIELGFQGRDVTTTTGSAYFVSPTAVSTGTGLVSVAGAILLNGVKIATLTGMSLKGNANLTAAQVAGSNVSPDIFVGSADVSGEVSMYFEDKTMRDAFLNETEFAIVAALYDSSAAAGTGGFVSFVMPRCKLSGSDKDDGEKGLTITLPFTALLHPGTTTTLSTTLSIQDSTA